MENNNKEQESEVLKGECKIGAFEHNKSIFHLGQCHSCYQNKVIEVPATPPSIEGKQDESLWMWDSFCGDFIEISNLKQARKYVRDNYCDGNEIHPDFNSFDVYKKVGSIEAIEENNIVVDLKIISYEYND